MKVLFKICLIIPLLVLLTYWQSHSNQPKSTKLKITKLDEQIKTTSRYPAGEYQIPFEKEVTIKKAQKNISSKSEAHSISAVLEDEESLQERFLNTLNDALPYQASSSYQRNYVALGNTISGSKNSRSSVSGVNSVGNHSLANSGQGMATSRPSVVNEPSRNSNSGAQARAQIMGQVTGLTQCVNPSIELFDLQTMNNLKTNPLQTKALSENNQFVFEPEALGLNLNQPSRYMIRTHGCDEVLERIITSFQYPQDLNFSSTIVASLMRTHYQFNPSELNAPALEVFLRKIEASSFQNTFSKLSQSVLFQNDFQRIFPATNHDILKDSYPALSSLNTPNSLIEKTSSLFEARSFHWDIDYDSVIEWYLDEVYQGEGQSFSYEPSTNSPSSLNFSLKIGERSSLTNRLDETKAFFDHRFNLIVQDFFPVEAPMISLSSKSTSLTNTRSLFFDQDQTNCETFSYLAITENGVLPTDADFIHECQEEILYDLQGQDGNIKVSFWSRDARNNVSVPTIIQTRLDTTAPSIQFINLAETYDAATEITVSFSVTDENMSGANNFLLEFFDGSSWSTLPEIQGVSGDMSNHIINESFTLPDLITDSARFRLSISDALGNFTLEESDPITLQKIILSAGPSTYNWGNVLNRGSGSSQNFSLTNGGNIEATSCITPILAGTNASEFSIISNTCQTTLASNGSCQITVVPNPETKGAKSASLQLGCNGDFFNLSLSFNSTNNPPNSPVNYSLTLNEDEPLSFNLNAGSDIDGDSLTYHIVSSPSHGTLSCNEQACTYTPSLDYNGSDSFTYRVNDGETNSLTNTTVALNILPVNDAPTLPSSQLISTLEDTPLNFELNAGSDVDGDSLTYHIVTSPSHGTLSCIERACTYTPSLDYNGSDSFTYRVNDGSLNSNTATVSITVVPVNDAPTVPSSQLISTLEDTPLNFELNAGSDVDGDALTYHIVTSPSHGTLSCIERSCTYTPSLDYNGSDSFTYRVNDGELNSNTATVSITVTPVNDAPTVPPTQSIATYEDTSLAFNLNAGSDVDGDPLTYHIITNPSHGTLSCNERACTYNPDLNFHGNDSFTYRVNDGELNSNTATVSITVISVNDRPEMIADQTFNMTDQAPLEFTLNGATDVDLPAQILRYRLITNVTHGHLENCIDQLDWSENLNCRYHPEENFQGEVTFTYRAFDGEDESDDFSTITFIIEDRTPSPIAEIALTGPEYLNTPSTQINLLSCNDIDKVFFSLTATPPNIGSSWQDCDTAQSYEVPILANNGSQTIYAWTQDEYQNIQTTPATLTVVFDNIAPVINISEKNMGGGSTETIRFTITELNNASGLPIQVEFFNGTDIVTTTMTTPSGGLSNHLFSHSITTPAPHNQDLFLKVTYTDLAGNTTVSIKNFKTDNEAPVVNFLSLNGGVQEATNNSVTVELSASDDISKVIQYCLKYNDSVKPVSTDGCWKDVNAPIPGIEPALSISFNNDFFQVGFVKAVYSIYAWVKDEAGVVSNNQANVGQDLFLLDFDPGTPPEISNVQATRNDVPTHPIDSSEYLVSAGQTVYVKWHASDIEGLDANPISLAYTINDHDYIPITTSLDMPNGQNSSCTIEAGFTGCTTITAPVSGYFRLRIIAKDDIGTTVYTNTEAFNDSRLRIIAGNTESGLGGSAKTALFYTYGISTSHTYAFKNKLVVSEDGKFFYLDPQRGLLWINPATGALNQFINVSSSSTGDNVHISEATVRSVSAIALDSYNHLLIWDNNLIRRVNLQDMTIRTIIGGGGQNGASATISALSFSLAGFHGTASTLIPLPNGDILFSSPYNHLTNRRYVASTQMIEPIRLEGSGVGPYTGDPWTASNKRDFAVTFNPITSELTYMLQGFYKTFTGDGFPIFSRVDLSSGSATEPYGPLPPFNSIYDRGNMQTGLDGRIYTVDRFRRNILRYDPATNSSVNILGNGGGTSTLCPEDTLATSCPVDIDSYFVTKAGRIYFVESGALRTIDDNNRVITLFGQHKSHGNNGFATLARIGNVASFHIDPLEGQTNTLIVHDGIAQEFRRFEIGSIIQSLVTQPFASNGPFRFEINPENGNIFVLRSKQIQEFDRESLSWSVRLGGGGTRYNAADGLIGTAISLSNYPRETNGFINGQLFYSTDHWTGSNYIDQMTKIYDTNDNFRQSPFLGSTSNNRNVVINLNSNHNSSVFRPTNVEFFTDPTDSVSKYFFGRLGAAQIYKTTLGGNLELFRTLPRVMRSFTVKKTDGLKFFYCSDGKLYQYDAIAEVETELSWSSSSISCLSLQSISYSEARDSVIFAFSQNGLQGIAEYSLIP